MRQQTGDTRLVAEYLLTNHNDRTAIEVELTLKSSARLEPIVEELSAEYDSVWYFAPDHIRPRIIMLAQAALYDNVTVHRYPPIFSDWRIRAGLDRDWD